MNMRKNLDEPQIDKKFKIASSEYEEIGVDVEKALDTIRKIHISLHCWQGDDVGGFETPDAELSGGGIQATGNYPGKARTIDELKQDYDKAFSLIPGNHRINIHAIYGDFKGEQVDRDQITFKHFKGWADWAKERGIGIDFNSTLFSHPKAASGFTLSSKEDEIRKFWIEHCKRCRKISGQIGEFLENPVIHNIWIPDGMKDIPVDRLGHRKLLINSLDEILEKDIPKKYMKDSIEGKLFGIGSESFVVGSNDFYLAYSISRDTLLTMDMGHYHPTESVADKISAVLPFKSEILLHVSRGVRWDSDHVVIESDKLKQLAQEIVKTERISDIHIGLDFFDASINRIAAWVIGTRATIKALLRALLHPWDQLMEIEENRNYYKRLAILEDMKAMPFGAIWDKYCSDMGVPLDLNWMKEIDTYENKILSHRK